MATSTMFGCPSCDKKFSDQTAVDQHRKAKGHYKEKNENESRRRCLDWVYSNNSNVHLAKDRAWFTEYTSFESTITDLAGFKAPVIGVGTVELPIEPPPGFVGADPPSILRLTTVLHSPEFLCNIIGGPIMDDYLINTFPREDTKGFIMEPTGRRLAYFDPCRPLRQVKLRNPPSGYYVLNHGAAYVLHALWSDSEREKWHAHQNTPGGLFSLEEKVWLKKHYSNEFSFLRNNGLSIYKDKEREDGRALLRTIMKAAKSDL